MTKFDEIVTDEQYTINKLVQQDWWVYPKSRVTLLKLIEDGRIKAVNLGMGSNKQYRIPKKEVIKFLNEIS